MFFFRFFLNIFVPTPSIYCLAFSVLYFRLLLLFTYFEWSCEMIGMQSKSVFKTTKETKKLCVRFRWSFYMWFIHKIVVLLVMLKINSIGCRYQLWNHFFWLIYESTHTHKTIIKSTLAVWQTTPLMKLFLFWIIINVNLQLKRSKPRIN